MTIAAGFACSDGLLVCADREITLSMFKQFGPKVLGLEIPKPNSELIVIAAGAGDVWCLEYVYSECKRLIAEPMTLDQADQTIRGIIASAHHDHIYPARQAGHAPVLETVFGIWTPTGRRLLKTQFTAVSKVDSMTILGIGQEVAGIAIDRIFPLALRNIGYSLDMAILAAAAVLRHAKKKHVQGCGGRSDMYAVTVDGIADSIETAGLDLFLESVELHCDIAVRQLAGIRSTTTDFDQWIEFFVKFLRKERQQSPLADIRKRLGLSPVD